MSAEAAIEVIDSVRCAVVCKAGLLVVQREGAANLDGHWELPGGKVDPGESITDAVVREVREETGYDIALATEPEIVDEYPIPDGTHEGKLLRAWATVGWVVGKATLQGPLDHEVRIWLPPHEALRLTPLKRASRAALLTFSSIL